MINFNQKFSVVGEVKEIQSLKNSGLEEAIMSSGQQK
jgi:hypothetical protein